MLLGCETSKTYVLNSEKGRAYTRKEATFHVNSSHSLTEVLEKIRSNPEVSAYENNIELGSLDLTQPLLLNMKSLGTALVAVSSSLSYVVAGTHEIWWNITYLNANPDGLYERRVIGINGTWPPPPIEVSSNDTLLVHAFNSLDVPTSLHHHGMFFPNRTHFDGAVGVSQCGIPPGQSFTYEVPILESAQWGTYWIHSHASGQYVDGLRGPVVIHHKDASGNSLEPHKYDEEITVVLGDWYHAEHPVNNAKFLSRWNPGGAEPVPESALIYFTANGTTVPGFNQDTTINFVPGKTYRLRVINVSALAMFHFWIDGHDMRIIEVDGTDVAEAPTPLLTLTVAQRYSVLVTARSDASQNFLVHANMDADMFDDVPPSLALNITSSITYSPGAPMAPEQTIDDYGSMPWDTTFQPVQAMTLPNPTKELELGVFFDTMDNGINRAMFNNVTWNVPVVPSTISALTMGDDASVQNVYGPNTEVVEYGEIMQMTVVNWDAGKHPFHLHGHKFAIMHRSDDVTSDDPAVNPPYNNNQANPIWRDTVQIESGGSVTLRWQADNPGAWIFHCHIEWHLEAGLASRFLPAWVFLESPKLMQQWTKPPQYYYDHCKALGVPTSGNAAGHNSTTDLSGLTIGPFPQKLGWNAKGIGAMTGCVLSAVLGIATVAWYSMGPGKDTDED